ncbi:MAG: hypothetical protein ISS16_01000 [Ignavibacteria bacterium]|nr:hypothetical protein [Ignavibacteria bacterium]
MIAQRDLSLESKQLKAFEISQEAEDIYETATREYQNANYIEAIEIFTKVIELEPEYFFAYHFRGMAYYYLLNFKKAQKDWDKASQAMKTLSPEKRK